MQLPLAIDLDGIADLSGDLQTALIGVAVMLALSIGVCVWVHLSAPVERRIHKRAGR